MWGGRWYVGSHMEILVNQLSGISCIISYSNTCTIIST